MKKIPFLVIAAFPYMIIILLICLFTISSFEYVIYSLIVFLIALYAISFIYSWVIFIKGITRKKEAREILRINMMIKLIHIPAYLLIFLLGLLCTITIFTIGVSIVLMIVDVLIISLSGLIGLGGVIGGFREKKFTLKKALMFGVLQYIFCADVVSSIIIYRRMKDEISERV